MLRDVAAKGVWVSAHPDVILKMGAKEVLYRTRHLGWGTDAFLYRSAATFHEEFPWRLQQAVPRVVKQNRGNGGQGVWKVEPTSPAAQGAPTVRVLQASRGSVPEDLPLGDFLTRCEAYFADRGCIIDQPFQPRLPDGMIRCYMGADKVIGFGHQLIKALIAPPPEGPNSEAAMPGPRIMHPASAPEFQALRAKMESDWTPQMMQLLDIDGGSLPIIWDAFSTVHVTHQAKTLTCFAKSISVLCFLSPSRRLSKLPGSRGNGHCPNVRKSWPTLSKSQAIVTLPCGEDPACLWLTLSLKTCCGDMQAPLQTVPVQALRSTRFVERIAFGPNRPPFQLDLLDSSARKGLRSRRRSTCARPSAQR